MATVALSTSPTTLDAGGSDYVSVTNTGSVDVVVSRGSQVKTLRPSQGFVVYPEGTAVTAVAVSGSGQVVTAATAARASQQAQFAASQEFTGTYAGVLPAASSYTYNSDGSVATETVAGVTTTFTYNTDGSVATMTRAGVTRTLSYNTDGTIAAVA